MSQGSTPKEGENPKVVGGKPASTQSKRNLTYYLCTMAVVLCGLAYFGWDQFGSDEPIKTTATVLIVSTSGALGGLIHSCRSFYYHAIEESVTEGRVYKYILRPFTGAVLALIFFYAVKSGIFTGATPNSDGLMGYAALGAVVGMFTDQASAKLKMIAEGILTKPDK